MTRVVIAFGSNLGDRLGNIQASIDLLRRDIVVLQTSAVYETAPMYVVDQPPFLNGAILGETSLGPFPLMQLLKRVEKSVGRLLGPRNGPREIDLDLLMYGDLQYEYVREGKTVLTVPHPRISERLFVLQPLADLDPALMVPGVGAVQSVIDSTDWGPEHVVEKHHAPLSVPRI